MSIFINKCGTDRLDDAVKSILASYKDYPLTCTKRGVPLPSKHIIIDITNDIRKIVFPGYFSDYTPDERSLPYFVGELILGIEKKLKEQIYYGLVCSEASNDCSKKIEHEKLECTAESMCSEFLLKIPRIREYVSTDVEAAFEGDPAATDKTIIISSYPGVFAVSTYRIAHELHLLGVPYIPRIITEYAHSQTGIDIHPGAEIDKYFFIDHGTGVVIGETCIIGKHVKIYQGVTLGALSTRGGQMLKGAKRHPTIDDNVTIYSGASVLGGDTVIGEDVVIGGNAFITKSVEPGTKVSMKSADLEFRENKKKQ